MRADEGPDFGRKSWQHRAGSPRAFGAERTCLILNDGCPGRPWCASDHARTRRVFRPLDVAFDYEAVRISDASVLGFVVAPEDSAGVG